MDILLTIFLPAITVLGAMTAWEDLKEGKIKNTYVLAGLAYSIAAHTVLFTTGVIDSTYLLSLTTKIAAALAIGIFLWYTNVWGAGDAKLYMTFVALIPIGSYVYASTQIPTGDLLINAFTVAGAYLAVKLIIETDSKQKKEAMIRSMRPKEIGYSILAIYSVGWLTKYLFIWTGIRQEYLLNIILLLVIIRTMQKIWEVEHVFLFALLAIVRLFVNRQELLDKTFLISFVLTLAGFIITMNILDGLATSGRKRVSIYNLKPGMLLRESFDSQGLRIKLSGRLSTIEKRRAAFIPRKLRLGTRDIDEIKKAHRTGKLHFNSLEVIERQAFAHYLFLAALMTIIAQGNVIVFLRSVI